MAVADSAVAKRSDLIGEVQLEIRRRERSERRHRRRMMFRRGALALAVLLSMVAVLVVVKRLADERTMANAIAEARAELEAGTNEALELAATTLQQNLEMDADHPETLGLLGIVRARQAAEGSVEVERVAEIIGRIDEDDERYEMVLARGMLGLLEGDDARVEQALSAVEVPDGDEPVERTVAGAVTWLRGRWALAHPERISEFAQTVASFKARAESGFAWPVNRRVYAELLARTGEIEQAREQLDRVAEKNPEHLAFEVDRLFLDAVQGRDLERVAREARAWSRHIGVSPRDQARARLARGVALLRLADDDDAGRHDLEEAWEGLRPWDRAARDVAIETALEAGEGERVERWLEAEGIEEPIYGAWVELVSARPKEALARLAELAQDEPRVAYLQALALVEQGRWGEAAVWVDQASRRGADGRALAVAKARVDAHGSDDPQTIEGAVARLKEIADEAPWTPRVWTGLAEALQAGAGPRMDDSTRMVLMEALEEAVAREGAPAQAHWILGSLALERAEREPKATLEAIEAFEKASEIAPEFVRYRVSLGKALADADRPQEARGVLETLLEDANSDARGILRLVELDLDEAQRRGTQPSAEIDAWMQGAAKAGATEAELAKAEARIALVRGDGAAIEQVEPRLRAALEQDAKDVEARVLLSDVLLALGDEDGARDLMVRGSRILGRAHEGRLYLAWSRVENARGKKRRAASLAFQGWKKMVAEPRPASELVRAATYGAEQWLDLDQPRGARAIGRDLTERAPWSARAWVIRSRVQLDAEYEESACESAQKAVELDPELPTAHEVLGDCKIHTLRFEDAKEAYQRALELDDGTVNERAVMRRLRRLG